MASQVNQHGLVDPAGFKRMNAEITRSSQVYRNALASTGMFRVEQLRVNSAAENYTKALQNQKLGLRDLVKQQKIASAAYREQIAMQQMVVRTSSSGKFNGKQVIDVSFPDQVNKQLDTFRNRLGWANEQMRSLATQTVNWGKNTQWAGRQLMTGFTIPVAIAAAAAGKFAYDMDASITRIQKVYDVGANGIKASNASIKADAQRSAKELAVLYGQSSDDTLGIMAELAAAGRTGMDLQKQTADVSRAMLLGDLDREDALKTNITLQSAYNMSTAQLADTWNFFNSVENSTVLSMKDITEALPRVSGIMNTLGVSVQDTTTLLAGFKAAGIDAVEGATALKSISFKVFNPSKKAASAFEQLTGIDYGEVIKEGKGELIPTLTAISKATQHLNNVQKTQIIGNLAGIHQGSKFAGLLTQLENIGDATTQIGRANQVAQQTTSDWANTANGELKTLQESISNRLKRSFQSLKVEMATMGEPFLKVGADILDVVLKLVHGFNSLPDGVKKAAVITAILLAATGPAIMLVGLTANLLGNFLKMGVSIIGVATKFELLSKEQRAAQLAAKAAESGFISERQALANLTAEMEKYRLAQEIANKPIVSRAPIVAAGAGANPQATGTTTPGGLWIPQNVAAAQANNATASQAAATASEKQSGAMKAVAESGALFAAGMVASAVSSNHTVDNIANIAMLTAVAGPALLGAAKGLMAIKWAEIGSAISGKMSTGMTAIAGKAGQFTSAWKTAPGLVSKTSMLVKGVGSGIVGLLGPMGLLLVAVGAVVAAWKLIDHSVHKTADAIKETNNNSNLGGILGYEAKTAQAMAQTSKSATAVHDKVAQIRNEFGGVIDNIKKAGTEQDKFNIAMQHIGLQVISQGGTKEQAQEAVRLALQAAGETAASAEAISIKFKGEFDSSGIAAQATKAAQDFQKSAMDSMQKMNFGETLQNNFKNDQYISKASEQFGKDAGDKIAQGVRTSMDAGLGQGKMLASIDENLKPIGDKLAELRDAQAKLWAAGEKSNGNDKAVSNQITQYEKLRAAIIGQTITNLSGADATKRFTESQLANMTATETLENGYISLTDADRLQYLETKNLSGATLTLSEAQELSARTTAKSVEASKKAAAGHKSVGASALDASTDLDRLTAKFKSANDAFAAYASAAQSGTKAAMQEYADQANANFSDRMNAAMDAYKATQDAHMDSLRSMQEKASKALDARQDADNRRLEASQKAAQRRLDAAQEAQDAALEKRQDVRRNAIEKSYDSRIAAINSTMAAEKAAEDQRQKIFDAEIARISRMAEVTNRNIDFNSALNSGNMDEAAKIMNDAMAAQQTWSASDANDAAKNAFDKRQDALGASADAIEKAKQTRLDALKAVEEAEKKALSASQQREKDRLDLTLQREKDALSLRLAREKDNLAARQKAEQDMLQKRIDANVKAEQRIWDGRKVQLDRAITDFQNFAPRNAAELAKHIKDISGKYDQFRVVTRGKFNGTAADVKTVLGRNITAAMNELAANKQWETVGAEIVAKMTKGAFNMDMNQFVKWVTTGETPKNWTASKAAIKASNTAFKDPKAAANAKGSPGKSFFHVGGKLGTDPGGRGGIGGNSLHHSEMPIVAKKGEFLVNDKATAKNESLLRAINSGADIEGKGGPSLGFAGMLSAGLAGAGAMAIAQGLQVAAARRMQADNAAAISGGFYTSAKAGIYGQGTFSAEQLANAAIIANVGSTMNMNARDIEIGIMTAITESGLKNLRYGDRDSQGLFQQRPSQGWGTVAQITDPTYAATKFFEALKGVSNRGAMDPWMAAQSVQRSFDSSGSNYKQYWDEAMAIFSGMGQDNGGTATITGPANNIGQNAIKWATARLGDEGWLGLCQKFVRMSLGAGGGFPSAIAAWGGAKKRHGISSPSAVPAGVPVYWGGGTYGHVALSTGGGNVISTDFPKMGRIGRGTISGISAKWHKPLLGWTEDINGKQIYNLPKFKEGGFSLSTGLAELHGTRNKPEATLSAPMTDKFKQGVDNFAEGGGNQYTFHIDARGTDLSEKEIAQIAIAGFEAREARKPVPRKGND